MSNEQRLNGAKQIIEKAVTSASAKGIKLDNAEWDSGQVNSNRGLHTLSLTSKGKTITGEFPDEWLADYPGQVGTGKTDAILREMIRRLGHDH